jgi:bidirectional [NiFe] hydrogenase diaphorase subunit
MIKIMHEEDFQEVIEKERSELAKYDKVVTVCCGTSCQSLGSDDVKEAFESCGSEKTKVVGVGCKGLCAKGTLVEVEEGSKKSMYKAVKKDDAKNILEGKIEDRLNLSYDIPFFAKQKKIVLENSGRIDPNRIEDYLLYEGYKAYFSALTEMTPNEVIEEVKRSGLRGRGGGGYPTGLKWSTVAKAVGDMKYVVCNGDEGDPGAFMDRSVMEADPHRVIEGMAIAAFAIGASKGFIYVRAEYPYAIEMLQKAIKTATRYGILGKNIFGTGFDFELEVRIGAGAFVCGEETALLASIEGGRGTPKPRPPYPAESGLFGKPTLINNVETYSNIAPILRNGGEWFAEIGTDNSKGTKVFAITGSINNTGIVEVPMGISLEEMVYDLGGGIEAGKELKAVQTGGPSGGCIPKEHLSLSVDYESLKEVGSMMGSGGMIVIDSESDMVGVAKFFMGFCKSESCGKCVPCRVGTTHMYNILDKITKNEAEPKDLELLEELCYTVRDTSLCGLGMSAPNPVLSTFRFFKDEYEKKLKQPACVMAKD